MKLARHLGAGAAALALTVGAAHAQISDDVVRIGVLTDMAGTYSGLAGPGALEAARMAVEDFGGEVAGAPIEIVNADHQNKADIAANISRQWFENDGVDALSELVTTSVALAVFKIAEQANKIVLVSGAASSPLTNEACIPTGVHYTYNTRALAVGTASAIVKEGGDTWYFLTADYAFGKALQDDVSAVVEADGGKVLGASRHPFPSSDFSSFVLQAQGSGAKVIGLANAGSDTTNAIKAANEFGLVAGGQTIAALLMFISDVHALGLDTAQGIQLTTGFYWDANDESRAWSKRFFERTGAMPTMVQAGVYSSIVHYLSGIKATGTDETEKVLAWMRETPINDFFAKDGKLRSDGRMVHDMYLVKVKSPAESTGPWDYYEILRTIPGEEAYGTLDESTCPTK